MYQGKLTFADSGGNKTTKTFEIVAPDHTTAITTLSDIADQILDLSESVLVSSSCGQLDVTGLEVDVSALPTNDSEIEKRASILCKLVNKTQPYVFDIPAPVPELWLAPTGRLHNQVNIANPELTTLMTTLANNTTVSDGDTIDFVVSGKRTTRRSSKG